MVRVEMFAISFYQIVEKIIFLRLFKNVRMQGARHHEE